MSVAPHPEPRGGRKSYRPFLDIRPFFIETRRVYQPNTPSESWGPPKLSR